MKRAEAAHGLVFVAVSAFAAGEAVVRWFDLAKWIMLFNVVLNAYPVMLQRYNRVRLLRIQSSFTKAPG